MAIEGNKLRQQDSNMSEGHKKLTLVSFMCRYKVVRAFVRTKVVDGRTMVSSSIINKLFYKHHGFCPTRGETISIGI
jgi:hypothetical protein